MSRSDSATVLSGREGNPSTVNRFGKQRLDRIVTQRIQRGLRRNKITLWYDHQCLTPTVFANFSPGLLQPWVSKGLAVVTLKELAKFTKL
jgi:hypothetical protein